MKKLNLTLNLLLSIFATSANAVVDFPLSFGTTISSEVRSTVRADLEYLFSIKGAGQSPFFVKNFGQLDGKNFKKIFTQKFTKIDYSKAGYSDGTLSVWSFIRPKTLLLNPKYYPGIKPRIDRIAQYIWATRVEANPEVSCPNPFLDHEGKDIFSIYTGANQAGLPNCDEQESGAYASTAIFLSNLSTFCSNCTYNEVQEAKMLSAYYLLHVSNQETKNRIIQDSFP